MGKSFTKFWEDYNDMCVKPSANWLKLHWKGYLVLLVASYVGGYGLAWGIQKIDEKKRQKYYEEEYSNQNNYLEKGY